MSSAFVIGSPVAHGHVRPLMPLARRLVERGYHVVWAISGDHDEPAAAWREQLSALGAHFVNVDEHAPFTQARAAELAAPNPLTGLLRRITGRANDVSSAAADAMREAAGGRPIVGGIYDFFAPWFYVAARRLGVRAIDVVVSGFPAQLDDMERMLDMSDPGFQRELSQLRTAGFGAYVELPRFGVIPRDPSVRIVAFCSPALCPEAPEGVKLLGVQREVLPRPGSIPAEHQALVGRLRAAREAGSPVVLLSLGTILTRYFTRLGPAHVAFLRQLYGTLAASALRAGAVVVASTCNTSAAALGIDEEALGPAAKDRVIALSFVPQPLLFAHGLVDVMLMHGGANTFYETVVSRIPVLVCPGFGDQPLVAQAAARLGIGVAVESIAHPSLEGTVPLARVAEEILPAMLAPGTSRWKAAATDLAERVLAEDGLSAAEAFVLGPRG